MSVKDVLILTGGQEEHHYVARALRDVLEEESGAELRVEVREVGQGGIEGWLGWISGKLGKGKARGETLGRWMEGGYRCVGKFRLASVAQVGGINLGGDAA